jgi:TatD DNase family protein
LWAGAQLVLAKKYHLPLFLHSRAAHIDFVKILKEEGLGEDGGKSVGAKGGVVHSFTGSSEEAAELVSTLRTSGFDNHVKGEKIGMGFYIGVNGCSMKTEQNFETLKTIPLDRLLLETGKTRSTVKPY